MDWFLNIEATIHDLEQTSLSCGIKLFNTFLDSMLKFCWEFCIRVPERHADVLTFFPLILHFFSNFLVGLLVSGFIKNNNNKSRASLVAQLVKNPPGMWETWVRSLGWEIPWIRERLPTPLFWPGESQGGHKESDTTERLSLFIK